MAMYCRTSTFVAALAISIFSSASVAGGEQGRIYATWSLEDREALVVLSADLLTAYRAEFSPQGWSAVRGTIPITSGAWYWETSIRFSEGSDILSGLTFGLNPLDVSPASYEGMVGPDKEGFCYWNGIVEASIGAIQSGAVVRHWVNFDQAFYRISVDGGEWVSVSEESEYGRLPVKLWPTGSIFRSADGPASINANFGASPFAYEVPPGAHAGVYIENTILADGFDQQN